MRRVLLNKAKTCPADLLSTRPAAGYATRRLTRRYTGPCLNVRRSSDNATKNIYFAGDVLDVQALYAFTGAAGSAYAVTWYDQIGSVNPTQATAGRQPRLLNAGVLETVGNRASMPAVRGFGGQGLYIATPPFGASGEFTASIVQVERVNVDATTWQLSSPNRIGSHLPYASLGNIYFDYGSIGYPQRISVATPASMATNLTAAITEINSVSASYKAIRVNKSVAASGIGTNATPVATALFADVVNAYCMNGSIAEIMFSNAALSSSDLYTIETNQTNFYKV